MEFYRIELFFFSYRPRVRSVYYERVYVHSSKSIQPVLRKLSNCNSYIKAPYLFPVFAF